MRRHRLSLLAAAGVAFALACSENSTGPSQSRSRLSPGGPVRRVQPVTAQMGGPEVYKFDITPSGGTVTLGDRFTIDFPPNAVCEPSSSSYNWGHWDDDCAATDKTINVNAKVWADGEIVVVDFSPSLRFVPSAVVTLSTYLNASVLAGRVDLLNTRGALGKYELLYSPDLG